MNVPQFIILFLETSDGYFSPAPIRLSGFHQVRIRFINEPAAMLPNPLKKSTDKYGYTLGALAVPLNRLL